MVTFQVNNMTCGHYASAIARAIAGVDRAARTDIRIQERHVRVTSSATKAELAEAINEAGYTVEEVQEVQAEAVQLHKALSAGGCCCSSRKAAAVDTGQAPAKATRACCG